MARQLAVGMEVYVPVARIGGFASQSALYRTKVQAVVDRSVDVSVPGGTIQRVAASAVHTSIGVLILRLGDLSTEETLLDPLAKSQLHFGRLLLTDDTVRLLEVRSLRELEQFWQREHANYAHVVLIGHGGPGSVSLAVDGKVAGRKLATIFSTPGVEPKVFVSLACETGHAEFAKEFSTTPCCDALLAPFHSVHGAVASHFCQTFLAYTMLEGETIGVAFRHARESVPGSVSFRLWTNGLLKT